jgi:competence protein ComEC
MLALARELQVEIKVPSAGMILAQDGGATLTALTDSQLARVKRTEGTEKKPSPSGNDQSLVLRLTYDQTAFLLPSDIEREAEDALLSSLPPDLRADVLVAPHHGSATSSSEEFLRAVAPRYVAISAGQNQAGHFPAPEIMARYQRLGLATLSTAERGSLFFQTDGKDIRVQSYR